MMSDLIVLGGSVGGISVAIDAKRAGLKHVRIIEPSDAVTFPGLIGPNQLDVGFGETTQRIETDSEGLIVTTDRSCYQARAVVVAQRAIDPDWAPEIAVPDSDRILLDTPIDTSDADVLIVGSTDHAIELSAKVAAAGSRVVLAAGGLDPHKLSPAGANQLRALERERRATVLYRSKPTRIDLVLGYPMVAFDNRRTPDLQFDYVVFASPRVTLMPKEVGASAEAIATNAVWFLGDPGPSALSTTAPGWRLSRAVAAACFPELTVPPPLSGSKERLRHPGVVEELREEHYNATITHFEPTHSDLWVLRVKPDHGDTSYLPGQYASLGLGFWEDRKDDADDPDGEARWEKLIRRSYSISSRIFDDNGYLIDENSLDELEFYIVLVHPTETNVPALTPRLALKRPGDRIYLGPKVAGRYTLAAVTNPLAEVVFFGTGTGEAPHNGMAVDLLRKGHTGPIISAVSVRHSDDLGYLDQQKQLTERYPNYHYLPMPTREPDIAKRYLQDLIRDDDFGTKLGVELSPETTHVFLCGNPAMIGLPEETNDGGLTFPEPEGVVELLTKRGFSLDQRHKSGNLHYEEYW